MDGKAKVTKEVLCEESRFILANVMAESKYGRQNAFDDIRRVCEGAVSIPFTEYVGFLEAAGYLNHDRGSETLEITGAGEEIVNGGNLSELTAAAVSHFKKVRSRRKEGSGPLVDTSAVLAEQTTERASDRRSRRGAAGERYEKIDAIGSGGIGTVHRARQLALGRQVALKEIRDLFGLFADDQRPEITRRFGEVVRAQASLAHPNIVPIHDVEADRQYPFVITELCPNGSVRRLIRDAEAIPVGLSVKYLLQTLHALSAAHKQGVIHRGLKPENLLIDAHGNLKVSDFGFARVVERDRNVIRQVYVGMGTVAYMAPELFTEPGSAGPQSDIYALGLIFYELLTRNLPGRRSPMPSEIDPKLPKGLDNIFDLMTRDSRAERYSAVEDILGDFDRMEGLGDILDSHVVGADDPFAGVVFKEPEPEPEPAPEPEAKAADDAEPSETMDADIEAAIDGELLASAEGSGGKYRPYSYQQRNKKS